MFVNPYFWIQVIKSVEKTFIVNVEVEDILNPGMFC